MANSSLSRIAIPLDSVDYILLQQEKMSKLQNQIEAVENQMFERSKLLRQIERLQGQEDARTARVLSRLNGPNHVLNDEVSRLYGTNTALDYSDSPVHAGVIEDILTHRTKEHSLAQQEKQMQIKYLHMEKRRLQEARERLHKKRQYLARNPSPIERNLSDLVPEVIMTPPKVRSATSVHSQGSYVRRAVQNLPKSINRIWKLREDVENDYRRKNKPYTGHLGIESYLPYQLEDYVIVRELVENFVDECIKTHIIPDPGFTDTLKQRVLMNNEIGGVWSDLSGSATEKRILQLVMEELVLEQTRKLSAEIVEEVLHLNGILRNKTDFILMNQAERISTGKKEGREPSESAYNIVTKGYFSMVDTRNKHRKEIWGHSQPVQTRSNNNTNDDNSQPIRVDVFDSTNSPNKPVQKTGSNNYNKANTPTGSNHFNNNSNNPTTQGHSRFQENRNQDIQEEPTDIDTEVLSYNHIIPVTLRKYDPIKTDSKQLKTQKINTSRYINREVKYWQNIKEDISKVNISKKCKGIQTVRPSPNSNMLAIGTVHGDIIIYDIQQEPWRVIRLVYNVSSVDDSVIDIAWSLDTAKLVTLNKMGSMQVWSFDGGGFSKTDARRALDIQADSTGYIPLQLSRLVVLDDDVKDFTFKQGPFSDQGILDSIHSPVKTSFYPSFTFLGSQHSVCVGLDNGDILKCNMESLLAQTENAQDQDVVYLEAPRIYQENIYNEKFGVNLIGENIEAELYRHHKQTIIYIGYIYNMTKLITVDINGFINIWQYDSQFASEFGWYLPYKKLKLDLTKMVYTSVDTQTNTKFTDQSTSKTRNEITRERQRVQNLLNNMMLGDPWHEKLSEDKKLMTSIYTPKGQVKESGSLFNVIIRHTTTNQLSSYITQLYRPLKVKCSKLIGVRQSYSGEELIFILLFPEALPKEAHLCILVLDLKTFKLKDMRRDMNITTRDYDNIMQQDSIDFDVSPVLGPTGADYVYICVNGKVRIVSLNTGSMVIKTDNTDRVTKFPGRVVEATSLPLMKNSHVTSVYDANLLTSVFYSEKSTTLHVLKLKDENSPQDRQMISKSFQMWGMKERASVDLRTDSTSYKPSNNQAIEIDMRELVLELADRALQKKGVLIPPDTQIINSQEAYQNILRQVQERAVL